MLRLVARQTAPFHGRPILRIVDDGAVSPGNFGKVVPVAAIVVERNITVGQIQIQRAIVVQIAELRAETPAADFDAKVSRQILKLYLVAAGALFRHPQIIPLNQHALFGNVRNVYRITPLVENVAKAGAHSALRCESDARLLAYFVEALSIIEIKFRHAVIIRDEKIGVARATKISGGRRQSPATTIDANVFTDFLEFSISQIVKEILAATVFRIFEAVRHHLR